MGTVEHIDYGTSWTGPVVKEKDLPDPPPTMEELVRKPRKPRVSYIGRYHVHDSADMVNTLRGFDGFENAWRLVEELLIAGKRPVMRDCQPGGLGRIYPTPGECGPTGTGGKRLSTRKKSGSELHGKAQKCFR